MNAESFATTTWCRLPPSSLGLDRTASAARSGRRELHERLVEHTETGPAMTGGDIDADWESAYSVATKRPEATIRRPTRTSSMTSAAPSACNTRTTRNSKAKPRFRIAIGNGGSSTPLRRRTTTIAKRAAAEYAKFRPRSRRDWRSWLQERHAVSSGVWLVLRRSTQAFPP